MESSPVQELFKEFSAKPRVVNHIRSEKRLTVITRSHEAAVNSVRLGPDRSSAKVPRSVHVKINTAQQSANDGVARCGGGRRSGPRSCRKCCADTDRHRVATAASDGVIFSDIPLLEGSLGELPGQLATPLALVVNELATNAVEHGTNSSGGNIKLLTKRIHHAGAPHPYLRVEVIDEGVADSDEAVATFGSGLGTQIIRTLVESDLRGSITWERQRPDQYGAAGTRAIVMIPLDH